MSVLSDFRERYLVRFTATSEMYDQLSELQALMRHQIPDGDLTEILARAVSALLAQVRKQKFGELSRARRELGAHEKSGLEKSGEAKRGEEAEPMPEAPSRSIPAAIRRAVSARDGGCCTYVSPSGKVCGSRCFIEFHHLVPWAVRPKHEVEGIELRCRAHNLYEAERDFGESHMARFKKPSAELGAVGSAERLGMSRAPPLE